MAISKTSGLSELITQMQSMQAQQQDQTERLRRRLDWLESRRREFFDIVANGANDQNNRRKLEETERQADEIQALLSKSETELKSAVQEIRQRIMAMRNEEIGRLEDEARELRDRKEHVRNRLLPEAMARVGMLEEEENKLNQRFEELMRTIRDLNQLDPTNLDQSKVA